jgi:tetratricopeptide (TPR) repeat protein
VSSADLQQVLSANIAGKAKLFEQLGKDREAERIYKDALNQDPQNVQLLFLYALFLDEKQNKREEAIRCYDQINDLDSTILAAFHNKAVLLWQIGRTENALAVFNQVLRIHSQFSQSIFGAAVTLQELARYTDASKLYQ